PDHDWNRNLNRQAPVCVRGLSDKPKPQHEYDNNAEHIERCRSFTSASERTTTVTFSINVSGARYRRHRPRPRPRPRLSRRPNSTVGIWSRDHNQWQCCCDCDNNQFERRWCRCCTLSHQTTVTTSTTGTATDCHFDRHRCRC